MSIPAVRLVHLTAPRNVPHRALGAMRRRGQRAGATSCTVILVLRRIRRNMQECLAGPLRLDRGAVGGHQAPVREEEVHPPTAYYPASTALGRIIRTRICTVAS